MASNKRIKENQDKQKRRDQQQTNRLVTLCKESAALSARNNFQFRKAGS